MAFWVALPELFECIIYVRLAALGQHRVRGHLCAITDEDHQWHTPPGDQFAQLAHQAFALDQPVRHFSQILAGHVIYNIKHADLAPGAKLVMDEVTAPALLWQCQNKWPCAGANSRFAPLATTHSQALFRVQALRLLAVYNNFFAGQQDMQTAIAEPATLMASSRSLHRPRTVTGKELLSNPPQ